MANQHLQCAVKYESLNVTTLHNYVFEMYAKINCDLFEKQVKNNIDTDIVVELENEKIKCHKSVFLVVSKKLREQPNLSILELIPKKCPPGAFKYVYRWILGETSELALKDIMHVLRIGLSFELESLVQHFWVVINDHKRYSEYNAFLLYVEASRWEMQAEAGFFIGRVRKLFLSLVASKNFLDLNLENVLRLLDSSVICVHSEVEVFFAAIRWLSNDWPNRYKHYKVVMEKIRFGLMPKNFLVSLTLPQSKCCQIECFVGRFDIQNEVYEGMVYNLLYPSLAALEEPDKVLPTFQLNWPKSHRMLVSDDMSANWLTCVREELREVHVTYKEFLKLLRKIRNMGPAFMRNMKMLNMD